MKAAVLLLTISGMAAAADPAFTRAALVPAAGRKGAADFVVKDASGKIASLKQYRGKVLLLDFWATWCTGCKQEIPWFGEFQSKYGKKHFAVLGVSLDGDGWKVLKPYLDEHPAPYRMVLGDDVLAQKYGIETMPDTFLIDRKGKVAAAYRGGLVDRADIEGNIQSLLAQR